MKTRATFALLSVLLSLVALTGCQSGTNAGTSPSATGQPTQSEQAYLGYTLDTPYAFQGVTIKGDVSWKTSGSHGNDYYVFFDDEHNSHIVIRTALHGQTKTLADAKREFVPGPEESLVTVQEWENNGVTFNIGHYGGTCLMLSGCEDATGKGFLLCLSFDPKVWSPEQANELFIGVASSLVYYPGQTTIDYTEELYAPKPQNEIHVTSPESTQSAVPEAPGGPDGTGGSNSSDSARYGEGTHKVGPDIPAGEYKLTATRSHGYWEVTASSAADADIIDNDNFSGSTYVTVSEGQYLMLEGCYAEPVS